ncbi:MAG: SNF2-related protein [Alphaproteobacteria bacterium]|jgi:superfamily II DNA or RNA helicase
MNEPRLHRFPTPFAAYEQIRRLACFTYDKNLIPVFASANIKILPYQIAAARFALRSNLINGCILCDEGSLGKTYEALLIVTQRWYEGKDRILIVLPQNLMEQWQNKLFEEFSLPITDWKEIPKKEQGISLITYEDAVKNAEILQTINWDLAVFDEADFLFKPENKAVKALKNMVGNAFKVLLTPTPITLSIMDIYGLIHFIDESVLPDADDFYKRYFRKPENYPELSSWVSKFAFRTLKSQASQYVNFTNRLPVVINYTPQNEEKKLYELTEKYLSIPNKTAYPQMDNYQLSLQFFHTLSSSTQAFSSMLKAPIERATGEEQAVLRTMRDLADNISETAKMTELLKALKTTFSHLKSRRETQKAIIFVDNLITVSVLAQLLATKGYSVIKHTDENALKLFREDKKLQILICNDSVAKGLDIEYCPVVVNYDLLYNAVEMEQRICRCHRQGQQSDVLVINLLSKENLSDVRILELINKRTLQFDGIFGMSDDIVGNFDNSLNDILERRRTVENILADFSTHLSENWQKNEEIVTNAESVLFTTFTKDIAEKVTISPKYIEEQAELLNADLWEAVKFYFQEHFPQYVIDEEAKTISLPDEYPLPHLFYYNSGSRNIPYTGKRIYGMDKDFKPAANKITLTSSLLKGVFSNIECCEEGKIKLAEKVEPCEITFYIAALYAGRRVLRYFNVLSGKTESGRLLKEEECRKILNLPVTSFEESGRKTPYMFLYPNKESELDSSVENELKQAYLKEMNQTFEEDIDIVKIRANQAKARLEKKLEGLREQVKSIKENLSKATDRLAELKIKRELNALEKELKQKEEGLFLEQMQIDVDTENQINSMQGLDGIIIKTGRLFRVYIQ